MSILELASRSMGPLVVDRESAERLQGVTEDALADRIAQWPLRHSVLLHRELAEAYVHAVLRWCGVAQPSVRLQAVLADAIRVGVAWFEESPASRPVVRAQRRLERWARARIAEEQLLGCCPEGWPLAELARLRGAGRDLLSRKVPVATLVDLVRSAATAADVGTSAVLDVAHGWIPPDRASTATAGILRRRYPDLVESGAIGAPLVLGTIGATRGLCWEVRRDHHPDSSAPDGVA